MSAEDWTTGIPYYIVRVMETEVKTVDEFESLKEAKEMLAEYRLWDRSAEYHICRWACWDWANI